MNFKTFIDAKLALPAEPGEYEFFHRFLGLQICSYKDGAWYWENGEKIGEGIVRWWRKRGRV